MASWSPDDVRKQAPNWSLEGDGKLLEYMESISKTLDQKCNATLTNINKMLLSIDGTNVALGNTTNKLLALQHAQFVENRVYDEDETTIESLADSSHDMNGNSIKKTNSDLLTPMGAIQLAIDNGLHMLADCYEKVSLDLDEDESDDDEVGLTNIVFQPKDPYIDKPLPFIIGSKEWKEKWHVGLLESDLESDNENEVEQFSDTSSSNPSLSASIPSNAPTISESEGSVWGLNTTTTTPSSNPKPQKDLFNNSSSSDEDDRGVSRNVNLFDPNDVISKHNQMKKEHAAETVEKPSTQPVVQPQQTIFREQHPTRKIVNLFDDEPPELDISSSSSAKSKPVAAQTNRQKPLNLFDESDNDNDDIFLAKKSSHVPSKPSVNLFNDTPPADEYKDIAKTKPAKTVTNLFDDDNDDDDIGIVTVVKPPAPTVRSKITNLFDDDVPDDDLDLFIESKRNKPKMTASSSSSSMSETRPIVAASSKITKLFDDDNGVEEEFENKNTMPPKIATISTPKEFKKPVTNLFADDDDDKGVTKQEVVAAPVPAARTIKPEVEKPKTINLFEDDEEDSDSDFNSFPSKKKENIVKPETINPKPRNIFADDSDKLKPPSVNEKNIKEPPLIVERDNVKVASVKKLSPPKLFDEFEDDDDEFYSSLTTKKSDPIPDLIQEPIRVPIVEDVKSEEEPDEEVKIIDKEPGKQINLFSDEPPDDDFDELFKSNSKKSLNNPPPEVPPLDDVDDEDWLVGSSKSSNIFDKFNDESSAVPPPQSETKLSQTTSALHFSSVRLFDDMPPSDDNDDGIPEPPPILSSSSSSKSHIYYDDTDTFKTVDTTKPPPVTASYVLSDEPPVDDYPDISNKDEPDRIATTNTNFKAKLNAFNNSNSSSSSIDSDKKIKTQPKKLNTKNLSINVDALLPGAKRPTVSEIIKRKSTTSSSDENATSSAEEKIDTTPKYNDGTTTMVTTEDGDKNILQSLQRSRAKIQVKRRPSTRQARHDVYRKSMIDDDSTIGNDTPVIPTSKSEPISITQALLNLQNDNPKSNIVESPKQREIVKPLEPPKANKISLFDDDELVIPKHVPTSNKVTQPPKVISLFNDDDLIEVPKIFAKDVKIAEPSKKIIPVDLKPGNTEKTLRTKTVSLFEDDPEQGDDLFSKKSIKSVQEKQPPPTAVVKETVKSVIFVDDDEDTDDLFARPPPIQKVNTKPIVQQQNQSLFSSDEDNDLFGSKPVSSKKIDPPLAPQQHKLQSTTTKKPPQTKSTNSNIKLFDSDDDNEDDLFGSSSTAASTTKTMASGKKSISQSLLFAKSTANNKLFDDSDGDDGNDDDIFKSKFVTSSRSTVSANKSSTGLNRKDKKVIKSTEVKDSDPLADLLK